MNIRTRAVWPIVAVAFGAAILPRVASAGAHFVGMTGPTDVVYCAESNVVGRFTASVDQYQSQGSCAAYRTPPRPEGSNQSTFPDPTHAPLLFQADWSATGSFNATTHEVQETVTLPAPTIDQPAPAGRPYGRFTSSMICVTDPWLDRTTACTGIKVGVAGNLGMLEKTLRQTQRPLSAAMSLAQQQALNDQRQQRAAALTGMLSAKAESKVGLVGTKPNIVAPNAGATARLGRPFYVRIATPSTKAKTYQIDLQRKDTTGAWIPAGTVGLAGAAAETANGALLTGVINAPFAGEPGAYRLRASADGGPASDWREFTVAGIAEANASSPLLQTGPSPSSWTPTPPGRMVPEATPSRSPSVAPRPTPNWGAAPSALGNR